MIHWVDLPPVWLVGFIALAWVQSVLLPVGGVLPTEPFGFALIGTGAALMVAAITWTSPHGSIWTHLKSSPRRMRAVSLRKWNGNEL